MISARFPRVDLHRHLEGSIRLETVLDLAHQHNLSLPATDLGGLQQAVFMTEPVNDIQLIFPRFDLLIGGLVDYDACRRVALECLEDAAQEGLDYVEVRFSPVFMAAAHGLDPQRVTSVVCEAWEEARERVSVQSRLLVILSRTYGPEACEVELECALAHRERGVVGIDLAGDEAHHPAMQFVGHFRRAREAGLHLTAHAGEFAGAESVRQTVLKLGVERVGHAVHAVDDPDVLDLLADKHVAVESCPTSNLFTGAVPSFAAHPLPIFLDRGLCTTLCTDDPTLFGCITLDDEIRVAREEIGLSEGQLTRLHENGLRASFLSATEKSEFRF